MSCQPRKPSSRRRENSSFPDFDNVNVLRLLLLISEHRDISIDKSGISTLDLQTPLHIVSPYYMHANSLKLKTVVVDMSANPAPPPPSPPPPPPAPATPDITLTPPKPDTSRKRARPTKSCVECRRKKLKCDRLQPCMQCKKLMREEFCTYAHGPSRPSDFVNENVERSPKRPKIDVSRLNSWGAEAPIHPNVPTGSYVATALPMDYQKTTLQAPNSSTDENQCKTSGRLQVEGSKSRYIGLGDRMTLLDHVGLIPLLIVLD